MSGTVRGIRTDMFGVTSGDVTVSADQRGGFVTVGLLTLIPAHSDHPAGDVFVVADLVQIEKIGLRIVADARGLIAQYEATP